ncbi:MAG TPA: YCF48-related protein, partial [Steroidobacteraceae bacterium]|nr:YCF48-related protein [Steroidobacteraceae bacterium]
MTRALAAVALAVAPAALGQDAVPADPAAQPAVIAPLAARSLLLDVAWAGRRAVAVGERGHILHSDDAGRTWTQAPVPASANLTAVCFADEKNGWAVGHIETILRTRDGGDSWELVHFEPANPQPLLDV